MPRRILGVFQIAVVSLASLPACDAPNMDARVASPEATTPAQPVSSATRHADVADAASEAEHEEQAIALSTPVREAEPAADAGPRDVTSAADPQKPASIAAPPPFASPQMGAMAPMGKSARKDGPGWGPATAGDDGLGGEEYATIAENSFVAVADDPRSTFSIDVDTASYSNMRRFVQDQQLPPADAVRIEEMVNYFEFDYAAPTGSAPFSMTHEVSSCPWNDDAMLVHVGLQGQRLDDGDIPARNLVFLLDVSGSMNSADKLPLVKRGLGLVADNLRKQDRVSIVVYAGASGLVLEPTADKAEIRAALDRLESGGSTNGGAGIELAYRLAEKTFIKGGINRVILATDGDFNVGSTSQSELVKMIETKREGGVFLSVLGLGSGNIKDATMEMLADKGNGNYAYIDSIAEARKVLVTEAGSTLVTIAKDVKIQVEFNPAEVASYRLIGYENRKLAHADFNDDTKDAGEIGAGHSVTALYEVVPTGGKTRAPAALPLKYQATAPIKSDAVDSGELMTVKIRYKQPTGDRSELLSFAITGDDRTLDRTTDDFRFAAAVAEFGLLLRRSAHKGDASYDEVITLARKSLGSDTEGHRAEFLRLVEAAQRLDARRGE